MKIERLSKDGWMDTAMPVNVNFMLYFDWPLVQLDGFVSNLLWLYKYYLIIFSNKKHIKKKQQ